MKKIFKQFLNCCLIVLALLSVNMNYAQNSETLTIPLSRPGDSGKLYAHILDGSITVESHNGKDVLVTATSRVNKKRKYKNKNKGSDNKNGLKKIEDNSLGFTVEERNNTVYVRSPAGGNSIIDFNIKVPKQFSMDLQTVNQGVLMVSGVEGTHEVSNTNGPITMKNISGSVLADALNRDIIITFDRVTNDAPMMFSSLNGDVDISFPSNLKANILAKTDNGDVYTDFEVAKSKNSNLTKTSKNKEVYRVQREKGVSGTINGGGRTINFKTLNGDILIRKNE